MVFLLLLSNAPISGHHVSWKTGPMAHRFIKRAIRLTAFEAIDYGDHPFPGLLVHARIWLARLADQARPIFVGQRYPAEHAMHIQSASFYLLTHAFMLRRLFSKYLLIV
jgi:hypothetical protein